jgi:hypothetical protein
MFIADDEVGGVGDGDGDGDGDEGIDDDESAAAEDAALLLLRRKAESGTLELEDLPTSMRERFLAAIASDNMAPHLDIPAPWFDPPEARPTPSLCVGFFPCRYLCVRHPLSSQCLNPYMCHFTCSHPPSRAHITFMLYMCVISCVCSPGCNHCPCIPPMPGPCLPLDAFSWSKMWRLAMRSVPVRMHRHWYGLNQCVRLCVSFFFITLSPQKCT